MNSALHSALVLAFAVIGSGISHAATGYLRPRLSYFKSSEAGASSTVAGFLGAGFAFGEKASHEVEIELGWASWDRDISGTDDGPYRSHSQNAVVPLLLNYRFSTGSPDRVGAYVEFGLGAAPVSADWRIENEQGTLQGSDSRTGVAAALGAGLRCTITESASLLFGVRYLAVRVPYDEMANDYDVTAIDGDAVSVEAALRFSF